jgi:hypothetical protein
MRAFLPFAVRPVVMRTLVRMPFLTRRTIAAGHLAARLMLRFFARRLLCRRRGLVSGLPLFQFVRGF